MWEKLFRLISLMLLSVFIVGLILHGLTKTAIATWEVIVVFSWIVVFYIDDYNCHKKMQPPNLIPYRERPPIGKIVRLDQRFDWKEEGF